MKHLDIAEEEDLTALLCFSSYREAMHFPFTPAEVLSSDYFKQHMNPNRPGKVVQIS